jgi:hypothetical protein
VKEGTVRSGSGPVDETGEPGTQPTKQSVDSVVEPIYRDLESGAITGVGVFSAIERFSGSAVVARRGEARHAAFGVVDGATARAERALQRTRNAVSRWLGVSPTAPMGVAASTAVAPAAAPIAAPSVQSALVRAHTPLTPVPRPRRHHAPPGNDVTITLVLENHTSRPYYSLRFESTDFIASTGGRIPAEQVLFEPPLVTLASRGREAVLVKVNVPDGTAAGSYIARVDAVGVRGIATIVTLEVT